MLKRRLKPMFLVFAALVALCVIFLLVERFRGQIALARYKQSLIAKGEKLSPQDFVRQFPEAENGAPQVIKAVQRLQPGTVLPANPPPRMRLVPSGRAIVGFREPMWVEKGTYRDGEWRDETVTNHWESLAADLTANEAIFTEIRMGLAKPVLNNQVDLGEGMKMKFLHLSHPKSLASWLGSATSLALHQGNNQEALEYLLMQIQMPRMLEEDRLVISELVRIAIAAIAWTDTWEALQADGLTDEDMAMLQKAWNGQEFLVAMARGLEGERVFGDVSAELVRRSNQDAIAALFGLSQLFAEEDADMAFWERFIEALPGGASIVRFSKQQVYCRVWRFAWSHQEHRHYLERMQLLIEIARDTRRHKSFVKALDAIGEYDETIVNRNVYDALRFPTSEQSLAALSRVITRALRLETERSLALCAIALKRHFLRQGQFPQELNELMPEFLPSVPIDYMDGQPLKYRLNLDGSFTLYSVGEDGRDDGGSAELLPNRTNFRDLWTRKDFVWPLPALPEEVETYRKESHRQ